MAGRTTTRRNAPRRGVAAVEFAVCLPLLFTIVFGSIQACNLLFLKNTLTTAAYEATLEASKGDATRASVLARAENILDAYGVVDGVVTISPDQPMSTVPPGANLTITVSAPVDGNVTGPAVVIPSSHATSRGVVMR